MDVTTLAKLSLSALFAPRAWRAVNRLSMHTMAQADGVEPDEDGNINGIPPECQHGTCCYFGGCRGGQNT